MATLLHSYKTSKVLELNVVGRVLDFLETDFTSYGILCVRMYACMCVCMHACVHVCMYDVRHNTQIPCTRYVAINHLYLLRPGCNLLLLFPLQLPSSPRVHIVDMKKVTRDDTRPKTSTVSVNCHRKRHETVGSDMSHRLASQSFHCHTASEHFR